MKRVISKFLALALVCSLCIPAYAAGEQYTVSILVNGSTQTTAAVGDEITVTLRLSKNGADTYDLYSMQDYVCFDPDLLQYVEESIQVYTVTNGEQVNELLTASPRALYDLGTGDTNRVFINRTTTSDGVTMESGATLLTFKLKALAQGTAAITHKQVEVFQQSGNPFSVAEETATVTIAQPTQTRTVTASFSGGTEASGSTASISATAGRTITLPENGFTRTGYTFSGWTLSGTTYQPGQSYTLTRSVTFTAAWTAQSASTEPGGDDNTGNNTGNNGGGSDNTGNNSTTPAGSTTGSDSSGNNSGGDSGTVSSASTGPITVTNPDGSTTTTEEDPVTGDVTKTTTSTETGNDGTTTERVVESVTTLQGVTTTIETVRFTAANGTMVKTVTSTAADGATETHTEAVISQQAVSDAAQSGQAVVLPMDLTAVPARAAETAPVVTVTVPETAKKITVEIPVSNVTNTTVALLVHSDGTEEIVKKSIVTDNGCVTLGLTEDVTVKLIDNAKTFADVDNHWAEEDIDFVTARTIFNGDDNGYFLPDVPMTRGMLAQVLYNLENPQVTEGGSLFPDVADDAWYATAIRWAVENGVATGYGDGTFGPEDSITREQLVTMLYRYFGGTTVSGAIDRFPDADQVSSYAVDAMNWAVHAGIIGGTDAGTLSPRATATRAQVATMLQRFMGVLVK
jgi:uncharacterized repeat protein (TIGR02543 family)